jgi:hypothetical protein
MFESMDHERGLDYEFFISERLTADQLNQLVNTIRFMVHLRLEAGDDPIDVLTSVWDIVETFVHCHADGYWPGNPHKLARELEEAQGELEGREVLHRDVL